MTEQTDETVAGIMGLAQRFAFAAVRIALDQAKISVRAKRPRITPEDQAAMIDDREECDATRAALEQAATKLVRERDEARSITVEGILAALRSVGPGAAAVVLHDGAGRQIMHEPSWQFARWLVAALAAAPAGEGTDGRG